MKTLLLNVTYTDSTDRFWVESCLKNKRISFDPDTENIHEVVKVLCDEQDGMELTYNGKPQGNIYNDVLDENGDVKGYETVGYMYRGKTEIYDRNMVKPKTGYFDVWITISEVTQFHIEELD